MKKRFFASALPTRFYALFASFCYSIGLAIVIAGARQLTVNDFDPLYIVSKGSLFNYAGNIPVALGHMSLVMLFCRSGLLAGLKRGLAAVGRMALTNYLMQSILCTLIFYGYGLGLYARFQRIELMGFVLAIWIFQTAASILWLKHFRFGPFEWLWRSLTYGRLQPLRCTD